MTAGWLALFLVAQAPAALDAATATGRLAQAEALARRGEPDAAADAYRGLLDDGVDTPDLRYALGTLELTRGRLGPAVLHLTAALRDAPQDDDAAYNLALAEEARVDHLADVGGGGAPLLALEDRLPPAAPRLAFLVACGLLALVAGALPWTKPGSRPRRGLARLLLPAVAGLAVTGAALALRLHREARVEGVVMTAEVKARQGPAEDAAVAFTAHEGLVGRVMEERDGWTRLRLGNGLEAWLPAPSIGQVR